VADRKPDAQSPQTVTLTGEWQRAACWVTGDARLTERQATLTVLAIFGDPDVACGGRAPVPADQLHWQLGLRAHDVGAGGPELASDLRRPHAAAIVKTFPFHEGSVSFWSRSPNPSGQPGTASMLAGSHRCGTSTRTWPWPEDQGRPTLYTAACLRRQRRPVAPPRAVVDPQQATLYKDGKPVGSFEREDVDIAEGPGQLPPASGRQHPQHLRECRDGRDRGLQTAPHRQEMAELATATAPLRTTASAYTCPRARAPRTTEMRLPRIWRVSSQVRARVRGR